MSTNKSARELSASPAEQKHQQWFGASGYGHKHYGQLTSFRQIDQASKVFHQTAREAAQAARNGDMATQTRLLEQLEQAASQLMQSIERLQQDVREQ